MAISETPIEDHIKYGTPVQAILGILSEYLKYSTIHGINYLGTRRPLVEKVWWMVTLVISLVCCFVLTKNTWNKWNETPVIVSFDDKPTSVWEIPFPAITFCPQTKTQTRIINFTKGFRAVQQGKPIPKTISRLLSILSQVCNPYIFNGDQLAQLELAGDFDVNILRRIKPSFDGLFLICKWRGFLLNCAQLFTEILTEIGVCYTFNMINEKDLFRQDVIQQDYKYYILDKNQSDWTLENGYSKESSLNPYPVRALTAGSRLGLEIIYGINKYDIDYVCTGATQGFKVTFHTPGDLPKVMNSNIQIPCNQQFFISVQPEMTITSEELKKYAPHKRQCFFYNEKYLRFFNIYSQENCELECVTNYTLAKCGCVKFSMPRDSKTKVCGSSLMQCIYLAENDVIMTNYKHALGIDSNETNCDCLPSCTSIHYDTDVTQSDYHWEEFFSAINLTINSESKQIGRIAIFFNEAEFTKSKRSELYGLTDFIANCGGLLGLFMGISILSFIEIFYFCTIRLISNLCMRKNANIVKPFPSDHLQFVTIDRMSGRNYNLHI